MLQPPVHASSRILNDPSRATDHTSADHVPGEYWTIDDEEAIRDAYGFHRLLEDLDDRFDEEDLGGWREYAPESRDE